MSGEEYNLRGKKTRKVEEKSGGIVILLEGVCKEL